MSLGTRVSPAVRGTSKGQPNGPTRTRQVVRGWLGEGCLAPSRALALEAPGREVEVGRGYPLDAEGLEEVLRVLSEGLGEGVAGAGQASLPLGSESASLIRSDAPRLVRRSNLMPLPLGSSLRISE